MLPYSPNFKSSQFPFKIYESLNFLYPKNTGNFQKFSVCIPLCNNEYRICLLVCVILISYISKYTCFKH